MAINIEQILKNRNEYIKHLKADLTKNDQLIESITNQLNDLKLTSANVKELGNKVEHTSLIPLGKNIYVDGKIIHTGEYFLDKLSFPESYSVVETLDDTIKYLESKIKKQSEELEKSETAREQLVERIGILESDTDLDDNLPKEIISDKGIAVKMGEFYEILEYEN